MPKTNLPSLKAIIADFPDITFVEDDYSNNTIVVNVALENNQ